MQLRHKTNFLLQPHMAESRRAIVKQAFTKLDRSGDGFITTDDLK